MNEVGILAGALGAAFRGDPVRLADVSGMFIQRAPLGSLLAVYVPPRQRHARPVVVFDRHVGAEDRSRLLARSLGHHYLRHRSLRVYAYSEDGAEFDRDRESREAERFAECFLACARPATTARHERA